MSPEVYSMAKNTDPTPIGAWIKRTRDGKCQSQVEAGKAIGVHSVTLCQWERGHKTPSLASLRAIASWGGVELGDLLGMVG